MTDTSVKLLCIHVKRKALILKDRPQACAGRQQGREGQGRLRAWPQELGGKVHGAAGHPSHKG